MRFLYRFDGLQDKIHDIFLSSNNPSILSSASIVYRVAMEDSNNNSFPKGSTSTLSTLDEEGQGHAENAAQTARRGQYSGTHLYSDMARRAVGSRERNHSHLEREMGQSFYY